MVYVSNLLGHTNLSTTSRYLNIHRRGLQAAMEKLEAHRPAVAQPLHKRENVDTTTNETPKDVPPANSAISIS